MSMEKEQENAREPQWMDRFLSKQFAGADRSFNKVHPTVARGTSINDAIFLDFMLHMWTAKTKKREGKPRSFIYRKTEQGFFLYAKDFAAKTGLSRDIFYRLVRKYEARAILVTTQKPGEMKYYKIDTQTLREWLTKRLTRAGFKPMRDELDEYDDEEAMERIGVGKYSIVDD